MSAYHQLGHQSESMVLEPELHLFAGAILSPVNYSPSKTVEICKRFRNQRGDAFDILFDPQLFTLKAKHKGLAGWPHVPKDFETNDHTSLTWWTDVVKDIVATAAAFTPNGICSPAFFPRAFDDGYYDLTVSVANMMCNQLAQSKTRPVLTALIGLTDLGRNERHLQVASILSRFHGEDIYLLFADDSPPRVERTDSGGLEGAVRLVRLLSHAGFRVLVGQTSSEMILWKAAGAHNVASGKFFNLRRFTLDRFDEEGETGGRQVWYWFEPSLLAFLREADIQRYRKHFPVCSSHAANPFSKQILEKLNSAKATPWLADSWRQFLYWFATCEAEIGNDATRSLAMLDNAVATWDKVKAIDLPLEDSKNDGSWVRPWKIALHELMKRPD